MSVRIELHQPHSSYTNLDDVRGNIHLNLPTDQNIAAITVKLEGESRTRLAGYLAPPGPYNTMAREQPPQLEVHKLLYRVETVFPKPDHPGAAPRTQLTLTRGQWTFPFHFKIPFNNDCMNNTSLLSNVNLMRMDMTHGPDAHVKRTLPPTLRRLTGLAEIEYFVKATVQRPAFYKENYRSQIAFMFLPIEPPRPPVNQRESYARVQHDFSSVANAVQKPGLFSRAPVANNAADQLPPSITVDGRLPDPPLLTCNQSIPLRILVTKTNASPGSLFLDTIHIDLVAYTTIRANQLRRNESSGWTIVNKSNLNMALGNGTDGNEKSSSQVFELDSSLWKTIPLLTEIPPSFVTCNIVRRYALYIKVGLRWGVGTRPNPELTIQSLRMPVDIYSGIAPPPALLAAMSSRPNQAATQSLIPPLPHRTSNVVPAPIYSPAQTTQTTDHIEPSPSDIPPDAPPSYEDAMAETIGPIDGPRAEYSQAGSHNEKMGLFND